MNDNNTQSQNAGEFVPVLQMQVIDQANLLEVLDKPDEEFFNGALYFTSGVSEPDEGNLYLVISQAKGEEFKDEVAVGFGTKEDFLFKETSGMCLNREQALALGESLTKWAKAQ